MDALLTDIADYSLASEINSDLAYETARWCLMDSIGCGIMALQHPECVKMLGPVVPNANLPGGCRVPGIDVELDPIKAAFDIGTIVRWLDRIQFNIDSGHATTAGQICIWHNRAQHLDALWML